MYIYIYIERERERAHDAVMFFLLFSSWRHFVLMDCTKSGRLSSPMSQSDGEENNTAFRRGNNGDVETVRENVSSIWAEERMEQKKIGSTGVI
jgi:hypothetical protein